VRVRDGIVDPGLDQEALDGLPRRRVMCGEILLLPRRDPLPPDAPIPTVTGHHPQPRPSRLHNRGESCVGSLQKGAVADDTHPLPQLPIDQPQQQLVAERPGERSLAVEEVFEVIFVQQWPDEMPADRPRQGALPSPRRSVQRDDGWTAHWHGPYRHQENPYETSRSVRPNRSHTPDSAD
jgi:hypothetical protein